jgi:glucuronyl/N-acetylglucosaminyl transferase EXT2
MTLFDAMKFNCIPIIVANEWILPFSEFLNRNLFSIQIRQTDLHRLTEILNQVDTDTVLANLKSAYDAHFSSIKAITLTLLNHIQSRVFPMLTNI